MIHNIVHNSAKFLRRRLPFAFIALRFCYQSPFVVLAKFQRNIHVPCNRASGLEGEHLFGYYDKAPWDTDGKQFISLRIPFSDRHPSIHNEASIELVYLKTGATKIIATTRAWNLQQGCRLQWVGPDFLSRILFNDFRDGDFVTVVRNLESGDEQVFGRAVYDVSNNGTAALSLDFERLHLFRPGYGYDRGEHCVVPETFPKDNGIWHLNLETGALRLIISLAKIGEDISESAPTSHISATRFNHIMINPSGDRFMFLYRWKKDEVEFTRLYTANMDGSGLCCLANDGLVSHATWKNNDELLVWALQKGRGEHFYLIRDRSTEIPEIVGEVVLTEDGHPSYSPCGRYILTDTYANSARQRRLIVYDTQYDTACVLGSFYAPFRYGGDTRCDLHPRWKQNGVQICIDSAYEGTRQVYILDNPFAVKEERIKNDAVAKKNKKVVILQRISAAYRVAFYEQLCVSLRENGIKLTVVYGQHCKLETADMPQPISCGVVIRNRYIYIGRRFLVWQSALRHLRGADLIIVQQATRNLINYSLLLCRKIFGYKLAYWGHGRNFQTMNPKSILERFKRFYSTHADFWFAYNDLSAEIVKNMGFPKEKIVSVDNAIDIHDTKLISDTIGSEEIEAARKKYGLKPNTPVGIFCSRLYSEKRLPFLIECLEEIRKNVSDFHFILIGDGAESSIVYNFAEKHGDWFHWVGAQYGREKICLFKLSQFQLMPGAVGLNIVESFALLTPIVTTDISYHGPEIHYLDSGSNGLMTENRKEAYIQVVVDLIHNKALQVRLLEGCQEARELYTIQNMVERFAKGICHVLT